jgi:fatty-acyl-CoA synthase
MDANSKFAREAWIRALERTATIDQLGVTLPVLIDRLAHQFGAAPALVSTEATLSYRALALRCNKYARWGLDQGLKAGDTVCLMMPNCAEYMAIWLGLTRIGAVVALVNNNLAGDALIHSINIVAPRVAIVAGELASRLLAVRSRLPAGLSCRVYGQATPELSPLSAELDGFSGDELGRHRSKAPPSTSTPRVPPVCRRPPR